MDMRRLVVLSFGMKCVIAVFFIAVLWVHYLVSQALFNRTANLNAVRTELNYGANVNQRSKSSYEKLRGLTPLMQAVSWNKLNRVKLLLEPKYKADVNLRALNNQGDTALIMAIKSPAYGDKEKQKKIKIIKLLLARGARINAKNNYGDTPFIALLDVSELELRKQIAKILISAGANINVQNQNGNTNLHLAIQRGFSNWIEWLLKKYGDQLNLKLRNNQGYTIQELAKRLGNEPVQRAVKAGIDSIRKT